MPESIKYKGYNIRQITATSYKVFKEDYTDYILFISLIDAKIYIDILTTN